MTFRAVNFGTPEYVFRTVLPAASGLLPELNFGPDAKAMLLAIGLQESRFEHRAQIGGPAMGFWQFERGGAVRGVMQHAVTSYLIRRVSDVMAYPSPLATELYVAIEHNDVLAACFARLLLYTLPQALPGPGEAENGWNQYISAWRPGKPHRSTWDDFYAQAWATVEMRRV